MEPATKLISAQMRSKRPPRTSSLVSDPRAEPGPLGLVQGLQQQPMCLLRAHTTLLQAGGKAGAGGLLAAT